VNKLIYHFIRLGVYFFCEIFQFANPRNRHFAFEISFCASVWKSCCSV